MTDGRQLLLLRHGKAAFASGLVDVERPLVERGERDAEAVGRWLRDAEVRPDLVLCSTARRARQTWDAVASGLGAWTEVRYDERVYRAEADELLDIVRETDEGVGSLLIVGHNPTLQRVAFALTEAERLGEGYPSGSLARVSVDELWVTVGPGTCGLADFVPPPAPERGRRAQQLYPRGL
ncbi:MAG: SixA phosphatase family protein [Streptosporangiaceae bacterium]